MLGYRLGSIGMALAYLALAASIAFATPPPIGIGGHRSVFDVVADSTIWSIVFGLMAVVLFVLTIVRPSKAFAGHAFLAVVASSFAAANTGTSIYNHSGWITAAAFWALTAGHIIAVSTKPLEEDL